MMNAELRDKIVAYVNADRKRLKVVKELEHKAEPLTTDYFDSILWSDTKKEVESLLEGLEKNMVVRRLPGKDEEDICWDLTLEARESLYALEIPASPTPGEL